MKKRCIYHVPYPISTEVNSASAIRPKKMLEAFKNVFDEVFIISGYGKERYEKFKELKKLIRNGIKFEFLYSENSTIPNLMTEKDHIPRYPFLERNIFKFCNKNHIPIGLFYRDIYWKFPEYKEIVTFWKRCIMIPLYKYDMYLYNKYINILYLPSNRMGKYVDFKKEKKALPPGCEKMQDITLNKTLLPHKKIELFYVGGVGVHYDVSKIIETVQKCNFVHLTLCCPKEQWKEWTTQQQIIIPENVTIIHKKGKELEEYYKKADLGILFMFSEYRKMAMPFKLFEYIEHLLPIITVNESAAGEFVLKNDIGWSIEYETKVFVELLFYLNKNRNILNQKITELVQVAKTNTWEDRAINIYYDLVKTQGEKH